jgi:hypothetical protein
VVRTSRFADGDVRSSVGEIAEVPGVAGRGPGP